MKRINSFLFVTIAMLMLSVNSAWAAYVKLTTPDGTESWIEIEGKINVTEIEITKGFMISAIDKNIKGSFDFNEVYSESGGRGTHYQVTSIGAYALYHCSGLTSVVIPSSVTNIGYEAFYSCSGLTSIVIPSSVTSIEDAAFQNCSGLTSVEISTSVTSIGNSAFKGCSGLTSIVIPSSVTSIGNSAFSGCSGLTSIVIPSSVTSIGENAFRECSGLTTVEIPSSVTNIKWYAFYGCSGLTSVVIPSGVTSIGDGAFFSCSSLSSIVIPSSVTSIGNSAFICRDLTSVISYITDVFETGKYAFDGCDNATLYVPEGLVSTYQSKADWSRFSKIEEIPSTSLTMSCNNKGKVKINGTTEFTNNVGKVGVFDGMDNTFIFQPNDKCELRQVLIDGLDVTLSVENNQLTTKVNEGSKMIVMFDKSGVDVNGDGMVNISDVVALVNLILGQ
ncbi:MAG: leucine-rich repeat protein [Bacteroidaceae bacterium]|nr:leucine-rich repeat protein [Bacteroidaceae bacterium]